MSSFLSHFPLDTPRRSQIEVLKAIEKAYKDGYKNVLLEAPVGSGKSAIAIAVAGYYSAAHILTPRKSLQDQYLEDFRERKDSLVTMKGRNGYPCTYFSDDGEYNKVVEAIAKAKVIPITSSTYKCSEGPCVGSKKIFEKCTENDNFPCPNHVAISTAQKSKIVIHNLHSFIFQTYFAGRFDKRDILIIDECHEIEGIARNFSTRKVTLPKYLKDNELPNPQPQELADWADWLREYKSLFSEKLDQFGISERERFEENLDSLVTLSEYFGKNFVPDIERDPVSKRTKLSFIPGYVGRVVNQYLLDYGDKRLLMSGTIYNKAQYCRNVGLVEDETCFIRIGSTFPKHNRPVYLKKDYTLDTSHKLWDENFPEMIEKIRGVFDVFSDVKGLIHTPSYQASMVVFNALKDTNRVVYHDKDNFQEKLQEFYKSEEPKVFLSPVCQQGVDFKGDRARFQIVLRVPYLNTSNTFVEHKVKNDFNWYNYQALVLFGQQIGRVNRSEEDFGVTILMDERFNGFIKKNRSVLPKWLLEAVIYE